MEEVISFTKIDLPYGWLGNMSRHPVEFEGRTYKTAEALFQALRFQHAIMREWICEEASPFGAKMLARRHAKSMVVQPRSEQDVRNMEMVLRLKIEQHADLRLLLHASGDLQIIEDATKRPTESGLFWGAALKGEEWVGQNTLGKLWMGLRR